MSKLEIIWKKKRRLDRFEQVVVLIIYFWFISRLWPGSLMDMKLYLSLMLLSESIVVFLVLIRRPTANISNNFRDWLFAFLGTCLPLFITAGGDPLMPRLGVILLIWGLFIHIGAKLSLFRSLGMVPANRGVKVNGLYAFVRHPMYTGYFFVHIGFLTAAPSYWNFAVFVCCWVLLSTRIFAEERLLLKSLAYQEYKLRVPYRFIPGLF